MATLDRILDVLVSRPGYRYGNRNRRRSDYDDDASLSLKPNAPRMITVVISIALAVAGLVATGTVEIAFVRDLLLELNLTPEQYLDYGHYALVASPALLVIGSFFRGI